MQINTEEKNPRVEEKNLSAEKLDNNGTALNKELCGLVADFGAVSTPSKENLPVTGSSIVENLNKTPQQKPRRRKHRPKVITEAKPRRIRKPVAQKSAESKENPTGKRKYVRKNRVVGNSTTLAEETADLTKEIMPKTAKRSCRRPINFHIGKGDENSSGRENATAHLSKDGAVVQETNEDPAHDKTTSIQHASNMLLPEDTQAPDTSPSRRKCPGPKPKKATTAKRKYTRKKVTWDPMIGVVMPETNECLPCDQNTSMEQASNKIMPFPEEAQDPSKCSLPKAQPRKYVTRNTVNKSSTSPAEIKEGSNEPLKAGSTRKSTRRSLKLDIGARDESSIGGENQNMCVTKENIVVAEEMHANLQSTFYISLPVEARPPTTLTFKGSSLGVKANGKTTRKRTPARRKGFKTSAPTTEMTELTVALMPESTNMTCSRSLRIDIGTRNEGSMCCRENLNVHLSRENSAAILSKVVAQSNPNGSLSLMLGSKREHSGLPKHPDTRSKNLTGEQYNCYGLYQRNYQEQRIEEGRTSSFTDISSMTTATKVQPTCPQDARWHPYASNSSCLTFNTEDGYNELLSNVRGLHSPALIYGWVRNYNSEANYSAKQGISDRQNIEAAERPPTCIDAPAAEKPAPHPKKKRSRKKNALSSSADSGTKQMQLHHNFGAGNHHLPLGKSLGFAHKAIQETMNNVDMLAEQFEQLNMKTEAGGLALQEQKALVPYNQQNVKADGTIIPYQSPFDPIKKHPRPKVDLDGETERVWKLLLIDINSHGIDGTDEDKAKWWEEERNVFRGRADSFIARMHLVQGDRRFSRWKGSVLDSVIGVFLTQNVSDHLSSSAFMTLAARYPIKSSSTCKTYNGEGTSLAVKEPHVHIQEPEEDTECNVKTVKQPIYDQSSMTVDMVEHSGEKESVNSNDSSRTAGSVTSLMDESNWRLPESFQRKTEERGEKAFCEVTRTELNDVVSSQIPVISSQISGDLSNDQTPKIGSCSDSNSKVEDLSSTAKDSSIYNSCSRQHALKLTPNSGGLEANCFGPFKTEASSSGFLENKDGMPCFQITESASHVVISHSQNMVAQEQTNHTQQSIPSISVQTQDLMQKERQLDLNDQKDAERNEINEVSYTPKKLKSKAPGKEKKDDINWDNLRIEALARAGKREKTENTMDSLDWEAVRLAEVSEISDVIKERGMNNRLAERIKNFLNRLVEEHGDIDLEWLRDVPPDQAKEYLLSVKGLGLKSVECVRLLTLHHLAFPVDTNVGRIAVRLGWVPLQPLPESLQLHLLELYPVLESIQKYLWPRLCKLDQKTLYELHYQMITFGKVFCTKSKPNCNACPMRGECRHFASAFASARLALPGPEQKSIVSTSRNNVTDQNPPVIINQLHLHPPENASQGADIQQTEVSRQLELKSEICNSQPIVEEPTSPETEQPQVSEFDMEDAFIEDSCEIPTIKFDKDQFTHIIQNYMQENMELQEGEMSNALVALDPEAASIPMPKLKNVSRLRTEHCVYELPDTHPLLEGCERRETDDPGKYLLAIWTPGETANSIQPPETKCSSKEGGQLCDEKECLSCNSFREANSQIVRGTLLIPCRTAMRGSFPLNGTYFQVNEVFADHDSSLNPISVPRSWIWNLNRRTVYFGTSMPTIFKGLSTREIQLCFWRGYVCVRGFDRTKRAPRPLVARLHFPASKLPKATETGRRRSTAAGTARRRSTGTARRRSTAARSESQQPEPNPEQQPELLTAASQGPDPNPEQGLESEYW